MAEVLFSKHHNNEAAHRYALSTLWNLAFNDKSRTSIVEQPGLVDAIRNILATTESSKTREVAKGALWTLGKWAWGQWGGGGGKGHAVDAR